MVPLDDARELARVIPSAQLDVITGDSHSLMFRNAETRRRVISFMQAVDQGMPAPIPETLQ